MALRTKRWTRAELLVMLNDLWAGYPDRLAALPKNAQIDLARQQGYDRPQDLLAHLGAWMAETLRVMPYLLRDERPPRDYANDQQFNRRAVELLQDRARPQVEAWYQKQRRALRKLVRQLPEEALTIPRVYRWLSGTIVGHYEEHPLPDNILEQQVPIRFPSLLPLDCQIQRKRSGFGNPLRAARHRPTRKSP